MNRVTIIGGAVATTLVVLALASGHRDRGRGDDSAAATPHGAPAGASEGLIYGRVTMKDGEVYEGRLRFGGDEEALWGNYFNGRKAKNPWAGYAPSDRLPRERQSLKIFGLEIPLWENRLSLARPFMARFGDIARIEPRGRDLQVVLRSGTTFHLDRYGADDVADGLRVWDRRRGVVDLGEWPVRSIEFLPAPASGDGGDPLFGTVRTRDGDFTGLVQWDREACLGSDELNGRTAAGGLLGLRFEEIRSIARGPEGSSLVTLHDGREIALSGTRAAGAGNRGMYVDDARYGRVLVSWDAFEGVDFSPGGDGPSYGAFAPGRPLGGTVITRGGRRLAGRLVWDLDESETTETLDAPSRGVDYTIPFDLIARVVLPGEGEPGVESATVTLRSGEELRLELAGDLGALNAGMLVFSAGDQRPEYVPWKDVQQVDFERPAQM